MGVIVFEYENDFNRISFERNACCMKVHLSCRHKQHIICYHVYVHVVSKTKVKNIKSSTFFIVYKIYIFTFLPFTCKSFI